MNDRFVEDLKSRVDIVEVIRKYAQLKKSGKNWMCRSPFRNERTPSFCVSPDKQFWYDFGSSEGGDVISFLEKIENFSFGEAVQHLADQTGLEVPKQFGSDGPSREKKQDLFALHAAAAAFFTEQLKKNKPATAYLADRGMTPEICEQWQIGYGGDVADGLTKFLLGRGYDQSAIEQSGVAFERSFGDRTMRDRFDRRIMLPIREPRNGEIIAFTGRKIDPEQSGGKYINSPENPVYRKSATLFGLHAARKFIRDRDAVVLVEGNFDVISAHAAGFEHTVATCGTALTEDHLRALKRLTPNIFLAFDSDAAGKKATLRGVEQCLQLELQPRIVEVTGSKDLDELFQKNPDAAAAAITGAQPALQFLFDRFAEKLLTGNVDGETRFLDAFFALLRLVARPIERDDWLEKISRKLNRSRQVIEQEFSRFVQREGSTAREKKKTETVRKKFTREQSFVGFLSTFWDFFGPKLNEKILSLFSDADTAELLRKKINDEPIEGDDALQIAAWELDIANQYDELFSDTNKKAEFDQFVAQLKKDSGKNIRMQAAKDFRAKMGETSNE